MKIGIAIPTYKKDIIFLDRCLKSIERQTKHPYVVSISASECDQTYINVSNYSFPIKIVLSENKQNAGTNRNRAGDLISDEVDIITFFDSDDEMFDNRLEFIEKAFLETSCDLIVHNFVTVRSYNEVYEIKHSNYVCHNNSLIPDYHGLGAMINLSNKSSSMEFAHGHISILTKVWKTDKFQEEQKYVLWEDSEYCKRLLLKGYKASYIETQLSKYHNYNETYIDYYNICKELIEKKEYEKISPFLERGLSLCPLNCKSIFYKLE